MDIILLFLAKSLGKHGYHLSTLSFRSLTVLADFNKQDYATNILNEIFNWTLQGRISDMHLCGIIFVQWLG